MKNISKYLIIFILGMVINIVITNAFLIPTVSNIRQVVKSFFVSSDGTTGSANNIITAFNQSGLGDVTVKLNDTNQNINFKDFFEWHITGDQTSEKIGPNKMLFNRDDTKYYFYTGDFYEEDTLYYASIFNFSQTGSYTCSTGNISTSSNGSKDFTQYHVYLSGGAYKWQVDTCFCETADITTGGAYTGYYTTGLDNIGYKSCDWIRFSLPAQRIRYWRNGVFVKQEYVQYQNKDSKYGAADNMPTSALKLFN